MWTISGREPCGVNFSNGFLAVSIVHSIFSLKLTVFKFSCENADGETFQVQSHCAENLGVFGAYKPHRTFGVRLDLNYFLPVEP